MPEQLTDLLATEGLVWLAFAALAAGMVRGFAGFGTAMVFLPVAGQFLSPFAALTVLVVKDLIGPLPNLPRAIRDGHPADILRLGVGLVVAMPFGVWLLTLVAPEVFRYAVSGVAFVLVALLALGIRYRGELKRWMIYLTGGIGGVLCGVAGLPGPPVIFLYMASRHPAAVIRANNMVYLVLADIILLALLMLNGRFEWSAVALGLMMAVPYLAGNIIGAAIFNPSYERVYRLVAFLIILTSAASGLPIWD